MFVGKRDRKDTDLRRLEVGHWKQVPHRKCGFRCKDQVRVTNIWLVHCAVPGNSLLVQKAI